MSQEELIKSSLFDSKGLSGHIQLPSMCVQRSGDFFFVVVVSPQGVILMSISPKVSYFRELIPLFYSE